MRVYMPDPPNDYVQYQYCPECNRILEIENDDIDEYNEVTCCFCGHSFHVKKLYDHFSWPVMSKMNILRSLLTNSKDLVIIILMKRIKI